MHIVFVSSHAWSLPAAERHALQHRLTFLEGSLHELQKRVVLSKPDLVLFSDFEQNPALFEQIDLLASALPAAVLILICANPDPLFLMGVMQAGVREVIASDAEAVIAGVIARVQARQHAARLCDRPAGLCLGFMPAKGGDGASCLAANLSAQIAKDPSIRLLLIDLSLPFGDVELFLTNTPLAQDLADVAEEIDRLDGALLEVMARHLSPNFHLIGGPATLEKYLTLTPAAVLRLVRMALHHYDYVVLDLGLDAISLSALELLDQLVLVTRLNLPSLRRASQLVRLWGSLGFPLDKLSLAVSARTGSSELSLGDVPQAVGVRVSRVVPRETAGVQASLLQGVATIALKPKSEFSRFIAAWAAELSGRAAPPGAPGATASKGKSLWHRFGIN